MFQLFFKGVSVKTVMTQLFSVMPSKLIITVSVTCHSIKDFTSQVRVGKF